MNTLETLKQARALVEKGWTKGVMVRNVGPRINCYCSVGAISKAVGLLDGKAPSLTDAWNARHSATVVMAQALFDGTDRSWEQCYADMDDPTYRREGWAQDQLIYWNDHPARTKEEVLAGFDIAIEAAHGG